MTFTKEHIIEELKASTQNASGMFEIGEETICALVSLLTTPPAPVSVPAAMEMDDDFDSSFEHGKAVGWNAYRAAMLQSFGNSEQLNSPVIPDGWVMVPVDMTPEQMRAVQLNSELGAYASANLSGAYSLFREFWDVAVKSAPNQEEK